MPDPEFKIIFTGDLSFSGVFFEKARNNQEVFSSSLLQNLQKVDHTIINLEGPSTSINQNKALVNNPLKSPDNAIHYLANRNVKIFNLANNHIIDFGQAGLTETMESIRQTGGKYIGAGLNREEASKPIVIEKNNIKVGLYAITQSIQLFKNQPDININTWKGIRKLKKSIAYLKKRVDWIVLNYHGGEEFTSLPSPKKKKLFRKIAKHCNIDILIGHHSHTFQNIENTGKTTIFYSLGNFVFDYLSHQQFQNTHSGYLVEFNFTKKAFSYKLLPIEINTENGIVSSRALSSDQYPKELFHFNSYCRRWIKDAYQVMYKRKEIETPLKSPDTPLKEKTFISMLLSKKFYRKSFKILFDKYNRSVYLGALIGKYILREK